MNAMFKEIRHGDIEKIRVRIAKNSGVVNEIYTGTKPKKDIGQSPLQVAIKCGQFEIIDLLIEDIQEITKKRLFETLDLLIKYGADREEWLNQNFWGVSNKVHFFEEKMYGIDNIDIREPIRTALQEYFS